MVRRMIDFLEETYKLVRQIPKGMVSTYGAIAEALGDRIAARAVGFALNLNPNPDLTPCYRVVAGDGSIGGFSRGIDEKIRRLESEGIRIKNGKIREFEDVIFKDFETWYPLRKLREEQSRLANKVKMEDDFEEIRYVAGFDAGYSKANPLKSYGAIVIMDLKKMEVVEKVVAEKVIKFPYVPTYLAFRELPIFLEVYKNLNTKPDLLLVDGNGILHPLKLGIASHIGVILDMPTIGAAKKLLLGEIDGDRIRYRGDVLGKVLYSSSKPIYVSPGHRISMNTAFEFTKKLCRYRIPEPIRLAHSIVSQSRSSRSSDL